MRPTMLGFRHPDERTAEFAPESQVTRLGDPLRLTKKTKKPSAKGTNFPQDSRFKEMPLYDRGSGQSVFLGPGSYNLSESYDKLTAKPCPTLIVRKSCFH